MENFKSHKREIFWYNIHVPRERSSTFFDIGGRHPAPAIGPKPVWADGKTPVGRDHRARRMAGRDRRPRRMVGTAFHRRPRRSGELRKRIRRPQHVRNISVLDFVAKPLTLHNEKPNTMVRRVAITRRILLSCFSLRFLAAPATRRDFEGAPLFFSAPKRRHPVR